MKLWRSLLVWTAASLAGSLASTALAQVPFTVDSITVTGTGCPQGSYLVNQVQTDDTQALVVAFAKLNVTGQAPKVVGNGRDMAVPGVSNCQIIADLTPSPGTQVALVAVNTAGLAVVNGPRDTDVGLNNVVRIDRRYFFNARANAAKGRAFLALDTPIVDTINSFVLSENTLKLVTYAGCRAKVRARISLTVTASGASNYAEISSIDEASTIQLKFKTRACSTNEPNRDPTIQPADPATAATYQGLCILQSADGGAVTNNKARTKVCYDDNGAVLSREPDPNL